MDFRRRSRSFASSVLTFLLACTFFNIVFALQTTHHKLRHNRLRRQNGDPFLGGSYVTSGGTPGSDSGPWTEWSAPSACSRTCGGGVATQERRCAEGYRCRGPTKKHFSCNIQDCPDDEDYRAVQCAQFNNILFNRTYWDWVPYTKAPNKCELNCMPRGERFYYQHSSKVADGTRCDSKSNDVCVDGICQPVGCDMMLGSNAKEDRCRHCGGDGSSCNTVSGILDMQDLQVGYNDILLIPAGATNIIVREIAPSNNYLAIRNMTGHYYLNGNWKIFFPKSLRFCGTTFEYERSPHGFAAPDGISALGPISEALYIVLLYQDTNVGIEYEYSIPKGVSQGGDPDSYAWISDAYTDCTTSCGGGYQIRNVTCVSRRTLEPVDESLCDLNTKLPSNRTCANVPCPPMWRESEWGECSHLCGEAGMQMRQVHCERIVNVGLASIVDDEQCIETLGPKPSTRQSCNQDLECPRWHVGPWKPCDHLCDEGKQTRRVTCFRKNPEGKIEVLEDSACESVISDKKPETEQKCELRPCEGVDWILSEWSGCGDTCGQSHESRKAHCATEKGEVHPDEICDKDKLPTLIRDCPWPKTCESQWFTTQWSECSSKCGSGIQTRKVFCGVFEGESVKKVPDDKCDDSSKYSDKKNCTGKVEACPGEWYSGPWSSCTVECGGGNMTRKVICMLENVTVPINQCESDKIPFSSESCNLHSCGPDEVMSTDVTKPAFIPPEDDLEEEEDEEEDTCEEYEDYTEEESSDASDFTDTSIIKVTPKFSTHISDFDTSSTLSASGASLFSDELMFSDSTGITDDTSNEGDELISTDYDLADTGSGEDTTSPSLFSDLSSRITDYSDMDTGSGDDEATDKTDTTTIVSGITETSSDSSGLTESIESTIVSSSISDLSSRFSDTTDVSASTDSADSSGITSVSSSDSTLTSSSSDVTSFESSTVVISSTDLSSSTDSSGSTDFSGSTDSSSSTESSGLTELSGSTESSGSTELSGSTESSSSTDSSGLTDSSVSTDSSSSTDISGSTDSSTVGSDLTSVSSSSDVTTESVESSSLSSDSSISTDSTFSDTSESSGTTISGFTDTSVESTASITTDSTVSSETDSSISSSSDLSSSTDSTVTDTTVSSSTESSVSSESTSEISTDTSVSSESTSESSSESTMSVFTESTSESSTDATVSTELTSESSTESSVEVSTTDSSITSPIESSSLTTESVDASGSTSFSSELSTIDSSEMSSSDISVTTETSDSSSSTEIGSSKSSEKHEEIFEAELPEETTTSAKTTVEKSDTSSDSSTTELSTSDISSRFSDITLDSSSIESSTSLPLTSESSFSSEVTSTSESSISTSSEFSSESSTVDSSIETSSSSEVSVTTDISKSSTDSTTSGISDSTSTSESIGSSTTEELMTGTSSSTEFISTESPESTVSSETETTVSSETETTVSSETETTGISASTESSETETTSSVDIWSTEVSPRFGQSATTMNIFETITKRPKLKKCKAKKRKCKSSPYGCCPDGITKAQGSFYKGCPAPKTCEEAKYGCCSDGVSAATGPDEKGCPKPDCVESLFGCCPDNKTAAEGNDNEGCVKEPKCVSSQFGCCPDNITEAAGPQQAGCDDCNLTEFGCCPDGIRAASGKDNAGCFDVVFATTEEEPNCATKPFGCCPDGFNAAEGINFQGCGVIDFENCTISYYGCCLDGTSPALGVNFEGCQRPCDNSSYGCCADNTTSAHGPNQEGCCLVTPHGCCPDNILTARGPNLEGCGCQYSPWGCCPDNATAARGPGNEGCGCQHTPHGCCPNRYTPAAGPNYEGCPCHTYQFGCCDDGVNVAKGPRQQGCGCQNTEFGCCSDDRTPATGPNFTGCDCASSKFGCCPDGITEAQGHKFEGCLDKPFNPEESCVQPSDRGSCRNYTVKWFYDVEYGGCTKFWYGGCEGNDNRFKTQEECKQTCVEPEGRAVCNLPKIPGACKGYYPRWHFNTNTKRCEQFIYSGCLGNKNQFETYDECQNLCGTSEDIDVCEQPLEEGPCRGSFTRWYYSKATETCEMFNYGGCKSSGNNFPTENACHQKCLVPGRSKDHCQLPREQGNCTENQPRWYFDVTENKCMPFYYTGCGGNDNLFIDRSSCEKDCPSKIEQDLCTLPSVTGECYNYTERWYYDTVEKRCRQFYYGGCGGNNNNFRAESECLQRCHDVVTPPPKLPDRKPFNSQSCFEHSDPGPCRSQSAKWFYDSRDGVCKQFLYGGCEGNQNNFESREECHQNCGHVQDICMLPKTVGLCDGFHTQWYYDHNTDTCEEFEYGGCMGNDNRFNDRESCERRCQKHSATAAHTTSIPEPIHTEGPAQLVTQSPTAICYDTVDVGSCNDSIAAWYYNPSTHSCDAFVYSGCGGNANRFESEEQCERHCGRFRGLDVCRYPLDEGLCRAYIPKIYFDESTKTCREFAWGGCGGSANRFSTIQECESICLTHQERLPPGNETDPSNNAICRLAVDAGSCEGGYYKRWHYDDDRGTCIAFIYSGCAGNLNRFKSFQSCIEFCTGHDQNEIVPERPHQESVTEAPAPEPLITTMSVCREIDEECRRLRCPYGVERRVDERGCVPCECYNPCRGVPCDPGYRCAVDLDRLDNGSVQYVAACREENKPGECPVLATSNSGCVHECYSDVDCSGEDKCCSNGCGSSCISPILPEPITTTQYLMAYTDAPKLYGVRAPEFEETETKFEAEEGNYVTIRCIARGVPTPRITWRKGNIVIERTISRVRILPDQSLQIVSLYRSDSGVYICTADNGVGHPLQKEFKLDVTASKGNKPAAVVDDEDARVVATLGTAAILHCRTVGWPRPSVTWWHGEKDFIPMSTSVYELQRDNSLKINSVALSNLGVYTCHAYNGIGKAASWSVTLNAVGPVYTIKPEDSEYTKYLIDRPESPSKEPERKPQYPYRPAYPQPPPRPIVPRPELATVTEPEPEIQPEKPRVFVVPVKANITLPQTVFPVEGEISIPCDVEGYPIPRVIWYKDGEPVIPNSRINITESNRLMISHAKTADSGEYRCEAENSHDRDASSVIIRVEGIFIHPTCTDNPFFANCKLIVKARYCTHKYYARFCCRSCTRAGQLPSYGPHLSSVSGGASSEIDENNV